MEIRNNNTTYSMTAREITTNHDGYERSIKDKNQPALHVFSWQHNSEHDDSILETSGSWIAASNDDDELWASADEYTDEQNECTDEQMDSVARNSETAEDSNGMCGFNGSKLIGYSPDRIHTETEDATAVSATVRLEDSSTEKISSEKALSQVHDCLMSGVRCHPHSICCSHQHVGEHHQDLSRDLFFNRNQSRLQQVEGGRINKSCLIRKTR
jgi:hypothetical protein